MDYCGSTEETFCFHEDAWRICPDYRNRPTCIWAIDDRGLPILIGRVMVPYRDMFGDSPWFQKCMWLVLWFYRARSCFCTRWRRFVGTSVYSVSSFSPTAGTTIIILGDRSQCARLYCIFLVDFV